jgi:hypothetical protein
VLTTLFAAVVLAGVPAVTPDFEIRQLAPQQAQVSLCFIGTGQALRFELVVIASGPAGRSRSSQSGQLRAAAVPACPVNNRIGVPASSQVEARLRWWLDGIEQAAESRSIRLE